MIINHPFITHTCQESDIYNKLLSFTGKHILELGCGSAKMTREIASEHPTSTILATDIDDIQIQEQRLSNDLTNLQFDLGRAEAISAADETFDLVLMFKSLHHVPLKDLWLAILETHRVLKPGGQLYICEPVFQGPMSELFCLFHNEEAEMKAAFNIIKEAVDQTFYTLENEVFFYEPHHYQDFEDFKSREIEVSYINHELDDSTIQLIQSHFEKHKQEDGYRILSARRVDLLRKTTTQQQNE